MEITERLNYCGVFLVIAFLLFKFGGWHIVWGHEFTSGERTLIHVASYVAPLDIITTDSQSYILTGDIILVRINKKFYGVCKDSKYFDAPLIQWGMLLLCIGSIVLSIKVLLTGELE